MTQTVHFGDGTFSSIDQYLGELGAGSVFLVTGQSLFAECGAEAILARNLTGRKIVKFDDVTANPTLPEVERGLATFADNRCDIILAVGGGTVIDAAKLIGLLANQNVAAQDVVTGQSNIESNAVPIVAAVTTSGSGSEATHFAVVYVEGKKYSVAHDSILPTVAIVDPQLTMSLPSDVTAATGLDAFCQAVESMWSVNSTDESVEYSREAISLVFENLESAVHRPNYGNRAAMCRASHLAGKAINITRTTAPHAISYTLTSQFGVPHGHAVVLTLGPMLEYNSEVTNDDVTDPRGVSHVRQTMSELITLLGCANARDACVRIQQLVNSVDLPIRLTDVGVTTEEHRDELIKNVNTQRLVNNPRKLSPESLADLLLQIG